MIKVGDTVPSTKVHVATTDGPKETTTEELFGGKKVVLFAVPGAFTPTCSARHLPGFLQNMEPLKAKGVDAVLCMAVNDGFVLNAWARDQGVDGQITMIADGNAAFTRALGLELDLTARGMGIRAQRFAMVVDDKVVKTLNVENPGGFEVSRAESVLEAL